MFAFTRYTLARQFMVISFLILLVSMVIIGTWVGNQIERGVLERTAVFTSLYINSYVSHYLQGLSENDSLEPEDIESLDHLMSQSALGQEVVSFKVWSADGRIVYSSDPTLINQQFEDNPDLAPSFAGEVTSEISDLAGSENVYERRYWQELIEIYAPIWATNGDIIAVSEFYQIPDALQAEIQMAKQRSWLVVGATTLAAYFLLAGLVGRASNTILAQQTELQDKATQNQRLHDQVRQAAAHTTALNEQFLRRISADLHDGPGQDLSLALLRINSLAKGYGNLQIPKPDNQNMVDDFRRVQTALQSAMTELRDISAGLRSPEIESLSITETMRRAVRHYERKTRCRVAMNVADLPDSAPLPVKIALFRIVQEALNNGYRHANGAGQSVWLGREGEYLCVAVTDMGPGFDPESVVANGRLGLAGMRERVKALEGYFTVKSRLGEGTTVSALLPLTTPEVNYV